jgi:hypothetical protein
MVHLSGDTNETVLTGLSGKYSIKTALNGSYTVTPYKTGYYFLPNSKTFSKVVADQTQDFSASVTNISQAPVLVSPAKDSYGNVNTISFSWNAISNVSGYELQLSTDNTFNNIILDNINYYNLVQTINNLAPNTLFYWRIRGLKGDDQGNWSEVWNFRTAASELSKPVITYPSYNLTNVSINPKLKWTAMEGASSYDVMISDKQDMSNIIVLYQFLELPSVNVKNLENNKTYYWKALSRKELATSEWTLPYKFTTIDAGVGVANTEELPESFSLSQNYPNPFNPSTTIQYSIIEPAFVTIKIFDIYGREVETLVNKNLPAGRYSTTWEPRKITSGVYYYKIAAGKYNEIRKMVYLR